jgi:NAD dependent epimerase/dehydratase family
VGRSNIDGATRALVTGAAGFIGCDLVDALASAGAAITGLDNERSGDWSRVTAPCRRVERGLADLSPDELADLCRDVDVVFQPRRREAQLGEGDAPTHHRRERLGDAPRPNTEYGKSKLAGERMLGLHGTSTAFDVMMKKLRRFVGDDIKIDVEFCDVIPLSETGKRSPVVSTVQENFRSLSVAAPRGDVP